VEDHEETAVLLGRLLKHSGHVVKTARDVASALNLAATEAFDVLISDIGLPDGTGYELMRQISSQYGIKGVALTGYGTEDDLRLSVESGFAGHVIKPVDIARLESMIARVCQAQPSA
jgi:CheY-like chemotaxis protein